MTNRMMKPMSECSDDELLQLFARANSQEAFCQLVERYLGMIYSAALRRSGNATLAEEAAQNTFIILARKARHLNRRVRLGGWLHRVVWFEIAEAMRRESRRQFVMQAYASSPLEKTMDDESRPEVLEQIDEALAELPPSDRDLLLLRFHSQFRFRQIASRLGFTEEASRKRVERALEKLRRLLGRKGVAVPSGTLAANLSTALGAEAPAGLALVVSQKALAAASASVATAAIPVLSFMTQAKIKISALAAVVALGTGAFLAGRRDATDFNQIAEAQLQPGMFQRTEGFGSQPFANGGAPVQRSARAILEEAAQAVRDARGGSAAYFRALLVLEELKGRDISEAVEFLESTEPNVLLTLAPIVAGMWAETDGPAAAQWAEAKLAGTDRLGKTYERIARFWALRHPEETYAWYAAKAATGETTVPINSFRWLPKQIFSSWTEVDPWGAVARLETLPVDDQRGAILGVSDALERSDHAAWILSAVHHMPDSHLKTDLVRTMAKRWARESPQGAAAWVDSLLFADANSAFRVRAEVAEEWLRHGSRDFLKAGAWVLAGTPREMHRDVLQALARQAEQMRSEESTR
jgi:RNA polymerase sigma factor (sigma-70 family)